MIEEQKDLEQTEDLILDEIKIKQIPKELQQKIEKIEDLAFLTLNDCDLASLENFPQNKTILKLELSGNKFPGTDLVHLKGLQGLQSLDLMECKISEVSELACLKGLKDL